MQTFGRAVDMLPERPWDVSTRANFYQFLFSLLGVGAAAVLLSGCATINKGEGLEAVPVDQIVPVARSSDARQRPRLGVAFGGGGVRGFVHLGVLRALDEAGIRADIVTGTSAGSIAASLYASGMTYKKLESVVRSVSEYDLADVVIGEQGVIKGRALAEWIDDATGHRRIRELPIPLGVTVTDLTHGKSLLVVDGDVGKAVQASSSVPGVFVPVQVNGATWMDGGILSLVPVRYARAMGADVILAIDIYCGSQPPLRGTLFDNVLRTFRLQGCLLSREEAAEADFLVRPIFEPASPASFEQRDEAIKAGYEAMLAIMPELKKRLGR